MSLKLKLEFADGTTQHVRIPSEPTSITIETPIQRFSPDDLTFRGLWITDTKLFVEVVSAAEAYTLNTKGGRMVQAKINGKGILYIDRQPSCKLHTKRIGAEYHVMGFPGELLLWPNLESIERSER